MQPSDVSCLFYSIFTCIWFILFHKQKETCVFSSEIGYCGVFGGKAVAITARSFSCEVGSFFDTYSPNDGLCSKEAKMQVYFLLLIVTFSDSDVVGVFYQYVQ